MIADQPAYVSWYDDGGSTACGFHAKYGLANKTLPCGAHLTVTGPSRVHVHAIVQDRGPYVAGREFDLNPGLHAATGCGDLCYVKWHLGWDLPRRHRRRPRITLGRLGRMRLEW